MGRYLIVANQTLGGTSLERTIRERIGAGDSEFFVLVPMTSPRHESSAWGGGFYSNEGLSPEQLDEVRRAMDAQQEAELAEARRRAERRLTLMIDLVREAGGRVEGELGDPDPLVAVEQTLEGRGFDEIIISTLPAGISRWLKMDLPSRISRMTDIPVVTIEAEGEDTAVGG